LHNLIKPAPVGLFDVMDDMRAVLREQEILAKTGN
jgi:hypothetical protein